MYESALNQCYSNVLPALRPFHRLQGWTGCLSCHWMMRPRVIFGTVFCVHVHVSVFTTGITIQALWLRLNDRPDFKLSLDDTSKSYFWNCILCQREVEFYKLQEERPDLVAYNRFHYVDPESHHFLETVCTENIWSYELHSEKTCPQGFQQQAVQPQKTARGLKFGI